MDSTKNPRCLLITTPRSASNLLVQILNLPEQSRIALPDFHGGYFFLPAIVLMIELKIYGKSFEEWTEDEKRLIRECYQNCFNNLEAYVSKAESQGQIAFVKEHSLFLTEPVARIQYMVGPGNSKESPWTVQIPSKYGTESTYSSLNTTIL